MTDLHPSPPTVSAATRNVMRANKRRDTGPEMKVRRWLHARGFRFRVDYAKLKGRPDVALPKHRLAIFVHGCYWHGHGCGKGSKPKTNPEFWRDKFARNAERHARAEVAIREKGWTPIVVWECDLRDIDRAMAPVLEAVAPRQGHPEPPEAETTPRWYHRIANALAKLFRGTPRR